MSENTIALPSELTIVQVSEFKNSILPQLNESDSICFDDKALQRIDTVGIQLLIVLLTELFNRQIPVTWPEPSELIKNSFTQLGVCEPSMSELLNL